MGSLVESEDPDEMLNMSFHQSKGNILDIKRMVGTNFEHDPTASIVILLIYKHIVIRESKPCNSGFYQGDFLSMCEYQGHAPHSVKFL